MRTILFQLLFSLTIAAFAATVSTAQAQVETSPIEEQYCRIGRLLAQKDYPQALNESRSLIENAPGYEHTYRKLTQAAKALGQLAETRAWLVSRLQLAASHPEIYFGLALIDVEKNDYPAAIGNYQKALQERPDFDQAILGAVSAYLKAGKESEAKAYLKSLVEAQPGNPTAHLGLGYYLRRTGEIEAAVKEYDAALALQPSSTYACFHKLLARNSATRNDDAANAIRQCQAAFDAERDKERLKADYLLLGNAHLSLANYAEARRNSENALKLADETGDLATAESSLLDLGAGLERQGEYAQALAHYQRGLAIALEIQSSTTSRDLGNMGSIHHLLGDFANALRYYREAYELAVKSKDKPNQSSLLIGIGDLQADEGDLGQAISSYEQAFKTAQEISRLPLLATCLNSLGSLYLKRGDVAKAQESLRQSLAFARQMPSPELESSALNSLGELHLRTGSLQLSIGMFQQALSIAERINGRHNLWKAQAGLAAVYEQLGQLDKAREFYEKAIKTMERMRARLGGEEEKAGFLQDKVEVYQKLIALLLALHRKDAKPRYDTLAFHYVERARARAFFDLLAEAKVDPEQNAAPDLLKQKQELQQRISQLTAGLIKERSQEISKQNKTKIAELEKGLGQTDAELGNWLRELRRRNPRYAALKYPEPITLAATQRMLDDKTILLSFSLAEPESFLFAVSHDDFQVHRLPSEKKIAESVHKLLAAITDKNNPAPEEYRRQAAHLSDQLLKPISQMLVGKKALVIVADGALHRLPFEVLFRPGVPAQGDFRRLPYLITKFAISYAPSASVLAELQNEPRATAPKGFIAFGDPVYERSAQGASASALRAASGGGRLNLQRLPYSHAEIDGIAQLFAKDDQELFFGEAASEENVKVSERLSRYRMVHFSTHGYVNEARPRFSGLVLSLPATEPQAATNPQSAIRNPGVPSGAAPLGWKPQAEDGLLSAYEIFNLKLKADLVVLSACETGLGKEVKGEGLMSLTRAFMYAGTPSVVVSLWNVNDESAADLMIRFYRHLKTGRMSKAEALRQAQLDTIRDNGFPFFWAPFVLVGKP
jgi:CHAT domain-containing protein/tetratricopeptide (TPR) repeat protein